MRYTIGGRLKEVVMGVHLLVASAVLLSGAACGSQPASGPAQEAPAAPRTAEQVRAEKFAATRDYRRERLELIINAAGGRGTNSDNGWGLFVSTVSAVAGASRFALDASPVLERFEKERPGESISGDDLREAAGGGRPDLPAYMGEEADRIVDQFLRSSLPHSLDLIAQEKRFFPPLDAAEPAIAVLLPQLGEARTAARFNAARMMLAAKREDEKEFVRAALHSYGVSRACAGESVVISHLVSSAIDALTMSRVIELNLEKPLSAALCRAMLDLDAKFPGPDYELSLRGEGLFCLDTINWVYLKGSLSDLVGQDVGTLERLKAAGRRALWVSRESALEEADAYFLSASRLLDKDPAVRGEASGRVSEVQKKLESEPMYRTTHQPFAMLVPALSAFERQEKQRRSQRGAYRVILAAELYRHEHGEYPASPEALAATLGELPRDWFGAEGAAIRYRRVDPEKDRLRRSYLVYSVGPDGVDNGGAESPRNQFEAISGQQKKDMDIVYNWDADKEPR